MSKSSEARENRQVELMQDVLITLLANAGVKQVEIRKIVGCSMDRVSRIAKNFERSRKDGK